MIIFRWIAGIISSVIIAVVGMSLVEPILQVFFIIFGGIGKTAFVDVPTDFGSHLSFFNHELLTLCFAAIISYGIGGYCLGKIIPKNSKLLIEWVGGISIAVTNSIICFLIWDSKHWFYSLIWIVTMIICGLVYICVASEVNE